MASKTKTVLQGITPAGVFVWPHFDKPDNSEFGKGKYSTKLLLQKGVAKNDEFAAKINELHKAAKGKRDRVPVKDGDAIAEDNEKRESWRGHWVLTLTSKNKPKQVDAGKKPLAATARHGDYGKLAFAAAEYDAQGSRGVTLYLNGVQLLERRALDATAMFEDESAEYGEDTAEPETPDGTGSDDGADDGASAGDDGDY